MARTRKVFDTVEVTDKVTTGDVSQETVEHSGVETWIPANKVGINTAVVCTDDRQVINGVEMARCFYK